jgi:hypothetical protein
MHLRMGASLETPAEHIATQIFDAIHQNVATKADLRETEARLQASIDSLRSDLKGEINSVQADLKGEMSAVRADLEGDVSTVRTDLKGDIASLRIEIERVRSELIRWVVGIGFAQVATLIAVWKLLPGAHP